jgi:hypothetical protein
MLPEGSIIMDINLMLGVNSLKPRNASARESSSHPHATDEIMQHMRKASSTAYISDTTCLYFVGLREGCTTTTNRHSRCDMMIIETVISITRHASNSLGNNGILECHLLC